MKACKRCFREFNEEELPDVRPTNDLADILLQDISGGDVKAVEGRGQVLFFAFQSLGSCFLPFDDRDRGRLFIL